MNVIVKAQINDLARMFYKASGWDVPSGYDFSKAIHSREKGNWVLAELSYEYWNSRMNVKKSLKNADKKKKNG